MVKGSSGKEEPDVTKKNKRGKRAQHRRDDREERGEFRRQQRLNQLKIDELKREIDAKINAEMTQSSTL